MFLNKKKMIVKLFLRYSAAALLAALISACNTSARYVSSTIVSSSLSATPIGSNPNSSSVALITTQIEPPILSPSPTPVPLSLILADFPLSVGSIWEYSAEITYQDPNDYTQLVTWSGFITDKVIDEKMAPDGKMVYTLQEDLKPTPPRDVWRQSRTFEYFVSGDGIFNGNMKIYQWPLSDNLYWKAFADFGYFMNVDYVGNVETPYSELTGCYVFFIATNPDTSFDTFCPGIGFVKHSYRHHGTPQNEDYTLISYKPGQ